MHLMILFAYEGEQRRILIASRHKVQPGPVAMSTVRRANDEGNERKAEENAQKQ